MIVDQESQSLSLFGARKSGRFAFSGPTETRHQLWILLGGRDLIIEGALGVRLFRESRRVGQPQA